MTPAPQVVRRLSTPAALALGDMAALFDDLQYTLSCCERLVAEVGRGGGDPVTLEAFWTTAVMAYGRCFVAGKRGVGLTEDDIAKLELQGDALGWHKTLLKIRDHYVMKTNPRESFAVGAAQGEGGTAEGIAVTSASRPPVDELSVRQTGAIAYGLWHVLNERINAQQETVYKTASALSPADLQKLPTLDVDGAMAPPPPPGPADTPDET